MARIRRSARRSKSNYRALRRSVRRRRKERGWGYLEMAARSGIPLHILLAFELGLTSGRLQMWYQLTQVFEVDIHELLAPLSE